MTTGEGCYLENQNEIEARLPTGKVTVPTSGTIDPRSSLVLIGLGPTSRSLSGAGLAGQIMTLKRTASGAAHNVIIDNFNDGAAISLTQGEWAQIQSDGEQWYVIATNATVS